MERGFKYLDNAADVSVATDIFTEAKHELIGSVAKLQDLFCKLNLATMHFQTDVDYCATDAEIQELKEIVEDNVASVSLSAHLLLNQMPKVEGLTEQLKAKLSGELNKLPGGVHLCINKDTLTEMANTLNSYSELTAIDTHVEAQQAPAGSAVLSTCTLKEAGFSTISSLSTVLLDKGLFDKCIEQTEVLFGVDNIESISAKLIAQAELTSRVLQPVGMPTLDGVLDYCTIVGTLVNYSKFTAALADTLMLNR